LAELVKRQAREPDVPESVYAQAKADLLEERAEAEARLARAQVEAQNNRGEFDIRPIALGLLVEWDVLAPDRRRDLLAKLIRHVKSYNTGNRQAPRIVVTPTWEQCSDPCCAREEEQELEATG
jgi:hypothetical protein